MFKHIKHTAKYLTAGAALVAALHASPSLADGWMNIQPAYNADQQHATVRVEGGSTLTDRLSAYAFSDIDATKAEPLDVENVYVEGRLSYALAKPKACTIGVAAEYNGGTGMDDFVRLGFTLVPKTPKGNFTAIKVLPYETSGAKGPQIGAFTAQQLSDRIRASILGEYNLDPNTLYSELELDIALGQDVKFFLQGRAFGEVGQHMDVAPVVGFKYTF